MLHWFFQSHLTFRSMCGKNSAGSGRDHHFSACGAGTRLCGVMLPMVSTALEAVTLAVFASVGVKLGSCTGSNTERLRRLQWIVSLQSRGGNGHFDAHV